MANVGYATLTVIPSMRGFSSKLNSGMAAPMAASGKSAGLSFAKGFALIGGAVAVTNVIKQAVNLEKEYSKTMRQIAVATGAPKKQLADLDDLAVKLGKETIFSSSDAADAMLELSKNGLKPAAIQAGALAEALTLAAAGDVPLKEAATTMGEAMNAFGLEGKDAATTVSSAIAGAANASSASVGSISLGLQQVSAVANDAGQSIEQTTGGLAAMANAGIGGSDAGTSMKTFFTRLIPSTKAARTEFARLGLSAYQSKGSMDDLAKLGIEPLSGKYGDVTQAIKEYYQAQGEGEIGTEANNAATEKLLASTGLMQNAFVKQDGSFKDLSEIAGVLDDKLSGMSESERAAAMNTLFGSDARRGAVVLMNEGTEGIEKYVKATSDQTQADKLASAAMEGTSGALESLSGSWDTALLNIGKGLAPLVEAGAEKLSEFLDGIDFEKAFTDFIDWAKEVGESLRPLYDTAMPLLKDAFQKLGPFISDVAGYVGDFAGFIGGLPGPVKEWGIKIGAAAIAFQKLSGAMAGSKMANAFRTFNTGMQNTATQTGTAATSTGKVARNVTRPSLGARVGGAARLGVGALGVGGVIDGMDETGTVAGALKTTLGAAAIGFAADGPWGAAIGFATGALQTFTSWSKEAEEAQKRLEERVQSVAGTFDAETGAITTATRENVLDALNEEGLVGAASTLGIDTRLLLDYAIDKPGSQAALDKAFERNAPEAPATESWADWEKMAEDANAANPYVDVEAQDYADLYNTRRDAYEDQLDAVAALKEGLRDEQRAVEEGHAAFLEKNRVLGINIVDSEAYKKVLMSMPKEQRTTFADEGYEITLGRAQSLLETYESTPKEIETALRALGYDDAANKANAYNDILNTLPPKVSTAFKQEGMDISTDRIIELIRKYNLTPAQVKTLMIANGFTAAEREIIRVSEALGGVDGKRAQVYIDVVTDVEREYDRVLDLFGDTFSAAFKPDKKAGGGKIGGIGTGTSDSNLAWLSKGEWVTRQKAAAYYGDDFMHRLNNMQLPRFATGGLVGPAQPRASISGGVTINVGTVVAHDYNDFMQQMQRRSRAGAAAYA